MHSMKLGPHFFLSRTSHHVHPPRDGDVITISRSRIGSSTSGLKPRRQLKSSAGRDGLSPLDKGHLAIDLNILEWNFA